MVKPGTEIPGQSYPERNPEKKPEHAGQVFAEHYALALKSMHPEDAVDVAQDAAMRFLESIGATREGDTTEYQGMGVVVLNTGEIAEAIVKTQPRPSQVLLNGVPAGSLPPVLPAGPPPSGRNPTTGGGGEAMP